MDTTTHTTPHTYTHHAHTAEKQGRKEKEKKNRKEGEKNERKLTI